MTNSKGVLIIIYFLGNIYCHFKCVRAILTLNAHLEYCRSYRGDIKLSIGSGELKLLKWRLKIIAYASSLLLLQYVLQNAKSSKLKFFCKQFMASRIESKLDKFLQSHTHRQPRENKRKLKLPLQNKLLYNLMYFSNYLIQTIQQQVKRVSLI